MTHKEYDVLALLARYIGGVLTRSRIMDVAWTRQEDPRTEYLRILIRNLRHKRDAPGPVGSVIPNELGVGYRLRDE
ncbi:winged helix-turn-helix domain-containing protein [Sphingomonas sp. CLY1604]|uniref:winged helix-turn-helix domain-containing protein n=1 Tax=Sphingomonas sp. CLY1604 TaxID=3457786 RepID=UPI003FD7612F